MPGAQRVRGTPERGDKERQEDYAGSDVLAFNQRLE
jgi:hypothetical protein